MIAIGFSTTNMILSRIIRWFTKSTVSHAYIIFDWLGDLWVLEAGFFGVTALPYSRFKKKNTIVAEVPLPGLSIEDLKPALDEMGENYDFGGLVGGIWPIIGAWFKKKWNNPWNNTKAMFCSELVVVWLKQLGYPPASNLVPADVTPEMLLELLQHVPKPE